MLPNYFRIYHVVSIILIHIYFVNVNALLQHNNALVALLIVLQ